jgi:hypothetical protein
MGEGLETNSGKSHANTGRTRFTTGLGSSKTGSYNEKS